MRKELEQELVERWPWFDVNGDIHHTLMPFGFAHGDGWFAIVWRLCELLEPLVAELERETGRPFQVVQVKEKFGGLCFYVNHCNAAIDKAIDVAEQESLHTCEACGLPGSSRGEDWIRTLCDACAREGKNSRPIV